VTVTSLGTHLVAIDYKTGKAAWTHTYPSNAGTTVSGLLTTGGKLLFAGDNAGNLIAFDPANGNILWHTRIGLVSNAPQTYMLDGHQYILAASGDILFAFTLY
jgi:alcohol dehydrogenase (cytochrome c)